MNTDASFKLVPAIYQNLLLNKARDNHLDTDLLTPFIDVFPGYSKAQSKTVILALLQMLIMYINFLLWNF